jgi:hypothetical protein
MDLPPSFNDLKDFIENADAQKKAILIMKASVSSNAVEVYSSNFSKISKDFVVFALKRILEETNISIEEFMEIFNNGFPNIHLISNN